MCVYDEYDQVSATELWLVFISVFSIVLQWPDLIVSDIFHTYRLLEFSLNCRFVGIYYICLHTNERIKYIIIEVIIILSINRSYWSKCFVFSRKYWWYFASSTPHNIVTFMWAFSLDFKMIPNFSAFLKKKKKKVWLQMNKVLLLVIKDWINITLFCKNFVNFA